MEIVLAILVVLVAIDAIGKLDERCRKRPRGGEGDITTQKIIVDLSKRR